jgi:hypothetical protein
MKDNARNIPGSIRSCRTPWSRSVTSPRRFRTVAEKCVHYAYKMRPNFKTQILINSLSITYAFDPKKCTHFPKMLPFSPFDNQSLATESHDARLGRLGECYPFSLGEKVRMRAKPVPLHGRSNLATPLPYTVHNGIKWDVLRVVHQPEYVVPTIYDDTPSSRPVFRSVPSDSSADFQSAVSQASSLPHARRFQHAKFVFIRAIRVSQPKSNETE